MYKLVYCLRDVSPWITQIQSIFNNAGFQYIWLSQGVGINVECTKQKSNLRNIWLILYLNCDKYTQNFDVGVLEYQLSLGFLRGHRYLTDYAYA